MKIHISLQGNRRSSVPRNMSKVANTIVTRHRLPHGSIICGWVVVKFPTTYIHISKQRGTTSLYTLSLGGPREQSEVGKYMGGLGSMSMSTALLGKYP